MTSNSVIDYLQTGYTKTRADKLFANITLFDQERLLQSIVCTESYLLTILLII
jgi:hypothetical protein